MLDPAPVDEVVNETEPDEVTEVLEEDGDVVTGGAGVDDVLVDDWVLVEEVSEVVAVEDVLPVAVTEAGVVDEVEGVIVKTGNDDVEEVELCATDEEDAVEDEDGDEDEDDVETDEEDKISLVLDTVVVVVATVLLGIGRVVRLTVVEEVAIPEKFARVGVAVGGLRARRFEHTLLSTREKLWVSS